MIRKLCRPDKYIFFLLEKKTKKIEIVARPVDAWAADADFFHDGVFVVAAGDEEEVVVVVLVELVEEAAYDDFHEGVVVVEVVVLVAAGSAVFDEV